MSKEYIERGAILDAIAEGHGKRNDIEEGTAIEIWDEIKKVPAADVVEVVRCRDCKHFKTDTDYCKEHNKGYCEWDKVVKSKRHFCSYGERKDEGK